MIDGHLRRPQRVAQGGRAGGRAVHRPRPSLVRPFSAPARRHQGRDAPSCDARQCRPTPAGLRSISRPRPHQERRGRAGGRQATVVLTLIRPVAAKTTVEVRDAEGRDAGRIVQQNLRRNETTYSFLAPTGASSATCRRRTGWPGTCGSWTATPARSRPSPATRRAGPDQVPAARRLRRADHPAACTSRCAPWSSPARSASRSPSGPTRAGSERRGQLALRAAAFLVVVFLAVFFAVVFLAAASWWSSSWRPTSSCVFLAAAFLAVVFLAGFSVLVLDVVEDLRAGLAAGGLGGVDRALQRGEQVDDLAGGLGRGRGALDLAALDLGLHQRLDGLGVVVLELARRRSRRPGSRPACAPS